MNSFAINHEYYDNVEKAAAGQSYLRIKLHNGGNNFTSAGTDSGSGAKMDLSVFQPSNLEQDYYFLGQVAVQGHPGNCPSSCSVVKPMNDDPIKPCLKPVTKFTRIWNDEGSGKSKDFSFWQPACEDSNYVAVGLIFFSGSGTNKQTPNAADYSKLMLVRSDLVVPVDCKSTLIWDDAGSHADANASLFALPNSNYFICSTGPEGAYPPGQYPDLPPNPNANAAES